MTEFGDRPTPIPQQPAENIPAGYQQLELYDPFEAYIGPVFQKADADAPISFKVEPRHADANGFVHPGMLLTFADTAIGNYVWAKVDWKPNVTLSMQAQFMGKAKIGDLVVCVPEMTQKTRAVAFVKGTFTVAGNPIMTVSSLWKMIGVR
jgi:acyl-coenzyme A thioesterase PaaI-like protein